MADKIPESFADLLTRETLAFANLALALKDGTPQVTPIWFDYEDGLIIINTARGRIKDKVLHRHPTVALSIWDPANPYRYLLIRGPVVDETEEGGYDRICDLNFKYHGSRDYPRVPGQVRVTYKVRPERVFGSK
jgi:PPOX class probable F420-dependent enzyme